MAGVESRSRPAGLRWLASMSSPGVSRCPAARAVANSRTRAFSLTTWRARRRTVGSASCSTSLGRGGAEWADLCFGAAAFLDPVGVARAGEDAGRAGDDDELGLVRRGSGVGVDGVRGAVEEQGVVGDAEDRRELVEQAGRHAACFVFGIPAQRCQRERFESVGAECQRRRDLQRRTRGQPGADRQVGAHDADEPVGGAEPSRRRRRRSAPTPARRSRRRHRSGSPPRPLGVAAQGDRPAVRLSRSPATSTQRSMAIGRQSPPV